MHELTAQVTSSLLPFPAVTLEAVGEDEITLDSVLHGKFTVGECLSLKRIYGCTKKKKKLTDKKLLVSRVLEGRAGHAWLACGPHLEFIHALTGERMSAYCFSGGGEHPPSVLTARDFSWLKRSECRLCPFLLISLQPFTITVRARWVLRIIY